MRAYRSDEIVASNEFSRLVFGFAPPHSRLTGRVEPDPVMRVASTAKELVGCYEGGFVRDPEYFNPVRFSQFQIAFPFMSLLVPIKSGGNGIWAGSLASLANDWALQHHMGREDYDDHVREGAIILAADTLGFKWFPHFCEFDREIPIGAYIQATRASVRKLAKPLGDDSW
jgi:hypothetical protein